MSEIINLLPLLGITMAINISLGMYYSIGVKSFNFDYKIFINGFVKALIIGSAFIGLAYCFNRTDLSSIGITPTLVMYSAIVLYAGKDLKTLTKIIGVETKTEE